ncbi:hypothetical protein I302_102098 [Kwoniella bestiolae CBS 10118]|uniref:Uncharacterized protein n=1 Tax=Kwoniella bestiolae CBS 10118 TaxID=1296100 RepID=A0A1B9GE75_9TREE|nr:hypothetical protein I302_00785 [Kwoniella bestiolae CBS 10118]OCF29285.1 hypothetical protein I302_00785 [Kwoniella bestiolae CBS 10118]
MRIKEANGLSVWLSVNGEKLDEVRVRKTGDEDGCFRMECFDFTTNVHLGRQKPWLGDWIAEPIISGNEIHALHIRKRWHVTHKLSTFFREDEDGDLLESDLSFGNIRNPPHREERAEGDDSRDAEEGMIVVEISRGGIERNKPAKRRISQRVIEREEADGRGEVASGSSRKAEEKTAYGQEFTYDEEDRERPYLKFVFKVRTRQYLVNQGLLDRVPAQQHSCQVSRTTRLKAEPDEDVDKARPTKSKKTADTDRRAKRELSEDSVEDSVKTDSAKRLRSAEEEIKSLKEMLHQLTKDQPGSSVFAGIGRR